jgi:tetratricopeptide (TPR) repeat protein
MMKAMFGYLICLLTLPILIYADVDFEFVEYEQKSNVLEMKEADLFFEATLYDKAIPLYLKFLTQVSVDSESYNRIKTRLVQAYYFNEQYPLVIKEVTDMLATQKVPNEGLYLLGMSYKKLKQDDKAITAFLKYLSLKNKESQSQVDRVYFELATANFRLNKLSEAKEQFEALSRRLPKGQLFLFCQLYLIQTALDEEKHKQAEQMINTLSQQISTSDRLHYAIDFLRGELAFNQKEYSQAIQFLEKGIPARNPEKLEWYSDVLCLLGWSYLKEAENSLKISSIDNAQKVFQKLVDLFPSEDFYLALGQALLIKGILLKDESAYVELEKLLSDSTKFNTNESLHYAFLLRAEASSRYSDRKKFFHQLTQENNSSSSLFAKAWYLRGLNELREGKIKQEKKYLEELGEKKHFQEEKLHFDQAAFALARAFELLYLKDNRYAALALKAHIQSLCSQNYRESFLKALSLISQLLNVYRTELFSKLDEPDEVYFLQGFAAAHLAEEEEETTYFAIAEHSLRHCIETYRQSKFRNDALKLLGILYYHKQQYEDAKQAFLALAATNPPSIYAAESWFWAANCLEAMGGEVLEMQQCRKNVYEIFPFSPLAPEAYLRYYSFKDYLQEESKALEHLQGFEKKYPDSPYLIDAHYLLALNACPKNTELITATPYRRAIEALDKVESSFEFTYSQNQIPIESLPHFCLVRYRACLDKASILMKEAENSVLDEERIASLKVSEKILSSIRSEMSDPQYPKSRPLIGQKGYDHLQEESSFMLIKCHIKIGDEVNAEKLIAEILEKYQSNKITRGYYLSRVWYERGMIAKQREEHFFALQCFKHAEECSKGKISSNEELLGLWIEQSQCYRSLGKEDDAMLILSRIINYDAVSSLRLKAMFLRAEIYEQQGRFELARKQLEAVAKKGGEWASKAQFKLEERYVYE